MMIYDMLSDLGIDDPEKYLEEFIEQRLLESHNLQQAFKISSQQMELFYRDAYTFYEREEFKEASDSFQALAIFDPFEKRYWMGLGGACQMLGRHEKALRAYAMASLVDDYDPYPHFYAYQCLKELQQHEEASKALALTVKRCNNPIYSNLKAKLRATIRT